MGTENQKKLMTKLFSEISNIIVPCDTSKSAPSNYVCLKCPGETVLAKDYDLSNIDNMKRVYTSMDQIPAFDKYYINSTKTVSGLFDAILLSSPPKDDPTEAAKHKAEFDDAEKTIEAYYIKHYQPYRTVYQTATNNYWSAFNARPKNEDVVRKAKKDMDNALQDWEALGKKYTVEKALAIANGYAAYTPQTIYEEARTKFSNLKRETGELLPVMFSPNAWAEDSKDPKDALAWEDVEMTYESETAEIHNKVKDIKAEGSANFWVIKGKIDYSREEKELNEHFTSEKLGFSFKIARVSINREWLKTTLITFSDTSSKGFQKKGDICPGSLEKALQRNPEKLNFPPAIPTELIITKELKIYGEFKEAENYHKTINECIKGGAKIGFGPFSIGVNVNINTNDDYAKKQYSKDTVSITVDGMQIIGYVNSVLMPEFPSADYTGENVNTQASAESDKLPVATIDNDILTKLDDYNNFRNQYGNVNASTGNKE